MFELNASVAALVFRSSCVCLMNRLNVRTERTQAPARLWKINSKHSKYVATNVNFVQQPALERIQCSALRKLYTEWAHKSNFVSAKSGNCFMWPYLYGARLKIAIFAQRSSNAQAVRCPEYTLNCSLNRPFKFEEPTNGAYRAFAAFIADRCKFKTHLLYCFGRHGGSSASAELRADQFSAPTRECLSNTVLVYWSVLWNRLNLKWNYCLYARLEGFNMS